MRIIIEDKVVNAVFIGRAYGGVQFVVNTENRAKIEKIFARKRGFRIDGQILSGHIFKPGQAVSVSVLSIVRGNKDGNMIEVRPKSA
ncbi:MAG: hypothetical protein QXR28_05725 [Nitrososphaerota archaeon]